MFELRSVFQLFNTLKIHALSQFRMHSLIVCNSSKGMKVKVLPALSDNYMYLVIDETSNQALVVDPVDPDLVLKEAEKEHVSLMAALITHHHHDHAGGNRRLNQLIKGLKFFAGDKRSDRITDVVGDGDVHYIGNLTITCIHTPCHTAGHICYYVTAREATPAVFTGDTLFVAGCGRFFEGTPEQMHVALNKKLAELPDETRVFCGHEYTIKNLLFASKVEPQNKEVQEKLTWAKKMRETSTPTVPSTIGEEKKINPFMRVSAQDVQSYAKCNDDITTMRTLRRQKDEF